MAAKAVKQTKASNQEPKAESATMAKSDDGTIQLTFSVPWSEIQTKLQEVAVEMGQDLAVPGFRKGKAPIEKVMAHISREKLVEPALQHLLPEIYADAVKKYSLRPVVYPKFELLKASDDEPWEMRATTAELPEINLGNYKDNVKGALTASSIWTPEKGAKAGKEPKEPTREEKEQEVIKALVENVTLTIPSVLIEEDVNSRLSQLLERIEKLGLNLDSYLASVGKTPQSLRSEYEKQSENTIKLELILNEIAGKENVDVSEVEINAFIDAAMGDPSMAEQFKTDEQKRVVHSILRRRKVLDSLMALA